MGLSLPLRPSSISDAMSELIGGDGQNLMEEAAGFIQMAAGCPGATSCHVASTNQGVEITILGMAAGPLAA